MSDERYIPAAGWRVLTPLFDPVMTVTTRERRWRGKVVDGFKARMIDRLRTISGTLELLAATSNTAPAKDRM